MTPPASLPFCIPSRRRTPTQNRGRPQGRRAPLHGNLRLAVGAAISRPTTSARAKPRATTRLAPTRNSPSPAVGAGVLDSPALRFCLFPNFGRIRSQTRLRIRPKHLFIRFLYRWAAEGVGPYAETAVPVVGAAALGRPQREALSLRASDRRHWRGNPSLKSRRQRFLSAVGAAISRPPTSAKIRQNGPPRASAPTQKPPSPS